MATEQCPECGHRTKVYSDAGRRQHYEGCSLGRKPMSDAVIKYGLWHNECGACGHREVLAQDSCPSCGATFTDVVALPGGGNWTEMDYRMLADVRKQKGFA